MLEAFFSSTTAILEFIKANSIIKTPIITAIFNNPNNFPPKNLFNKPNAAKSASLVNAFPARIIERELIRMLQQKHLSVNNSHSN